jgi:adenosyl cobinamide kinase/adenosyl cobinamide phosphate guanylyltransferase
MALEVLLGGARSGKSALALRRGHAHDGPVSYVATGEPGDAEMELRIELHRAERPPGWSTIEAPLDLLGALRAAPADALVIVDCLTLWISNQLLAGAEDAEIETLAAECAGAAAARTAPVVAVSNEVGMGVVPVHPVARRFRDLQGRVNALWVARAQSASLIVAGAALRLEVPS